MLSLTPSFFLTINTIYNINKELKEITIYNILLENEPSHTHSLTDRRSY